MKPVSLADMSYEQGLKALLLRKQALDLGKARRMTAAERCNTFKLQLVGEKAAFSLSSIGDSVSSGLGKLRDSAVSGYQQVNASNPELARTLLSTGLGAGAGALTGVLAPDKKHKKRNILMGALAGGALGGGLGLATNSGMVDKLFNATGKGKKNISDIVDPKRLEYLESNRLPSITDMSRNNFENVTPWATGAAGLGGATYAQQKALKAVKANPYVDADRLEGSISGLISNPPKTKGGKSIPFSDKNLQELFKDDLGKMPKGILPAKAKLQEYLTKLSPEQRKALFSKAGLVPDNVRGNTALLGRLQRAFGNQTAGELVESATEKSPRIMQLLRGKAGGPRQALAAAALGIPALAQLYFGGGLLGTGGRQLSNSLEWQMLNNRINRLQKQ